MKKLWEFIKNMFVKHSDFVKFCIVGVMNTAVTYIVFFILVKLGMPATLTNIEDGLWPYIMSYIINANTFGDIAGGINSYFWNSRWVFKNKSFSSVPKFILTFIVYMAISAVLMWLFVKVIGVNELLSKIIVIPVTTVVNFLMNKMFAFRKKKSKPADVDVTKDTDQDADQEVPEDKGV